MSRIYVIGGATYDIYASSKNRIIPEDSNIGSVSFSFGGVGRNIAENLAHLGEKITFISVFGNDGFSRMMYDNCLSLGFDMSYSKVVEGRCPIYLAVLDENRNMAVAINDMDVMNELDIEMLERLKDVVEDDDYLLVDTNLSNEKIDYIFKNIKGIKVSDAISTEKVIRLKDNLSGLSILKVNTFEAEALAGRKLNSEKEIVSFIRETNDIGTKEVIVTFKEGLYIGSEEGVYLFKHDAYNRNVKNVSGAGDASLAGYLCGRFHNLSITDSVMVSLANASLTIQSEKAVSENTIEDIRKQLKQMNIWYKKISD